METPEGGHGREVETQPQLEAYEGQEGDLPHEGTVLGPVSSQGCGQVACQDQPDCPAEELCRPSAALLEQEGAQHDGHHEGGEYFTQGKIFLAETLIWSVWCENSNDWRLMLTAESVGVHM